MNFEGVTAKQTSPNAAGAGSAGLTSEKSRGSVNLKHQRSDLAGDDLRLLKMTKPDEVYFSSKNSTGESSADYLRSNLWPLGVNDGQKMLSFSRNGGTIDIGCSSSIAFSIFPDEHYSKTGGRLNEGMRNGPFARMKGPFTPSQWMELEHQALIYKHFVGNVPVPSNLLLPLRKSLYLYGSYASDFLGWGPVHLGFSSRNNDPEPGRCRRTDGKKWRCSRDAVPDQKYCERHINRGRHRSRKPVEGHSGQTASGSTTSNVAPIASFSSASAISSNSASNSLGVMRHQFNDLKTNISNASVDNLDNRPLGFQDLSLIPPTTDLKSKYTAFPIQKQHVPFEKISQSDFGLVTSDSLVNPSERISFMNTRNSNSFSGFNDKETNKQHPVHHFIDDWPRQQSDSASGSWPEELKSDWTQLSMSIPVAPDFSSSSSSPAPEKSTISTLRLSDDHNPIHMSLGGSHDLCEPHHKQSSWLPVCWGNSLGGPLGEVLTSSTTCGGMGENPSSLEAWNNDSDQIPSSPTGKPTFVTLSNSSSGSSPPSSGNKKAPDNGSHCNDVFGSSLSSFAAIPSL